MLHPKIDTVVFDLGGVLVDWNPRSLYRKLLSTEEQVEWFLAHVCTMDWNERQDEGRTIAEAETELLQRFPEYTDQIRAFYGRFPEMFGGAIEETVAVLEELHQRGTPLFALTNWSAEKFPWARQAFPFFGRFRQIVVSGEVGLKKPDPRIFELLIERTKVQPHRTLYIDDRLDNTETARSLGFSTHHFQSPPALKEHLLTLGFLSGSEKGSPRR